MGGGDGSNNTTRSQLEALTGMAFPAYDNVIAYSDATGIYLGYNPNTLDVWVLTARHVSPNNDPIVIGGSSYQWQQRVNLSADLALVRYSHADNLVPALPTVPLAQTLPSNSDPLVMIGIGRNRVQNASNDAFTSDAIPLAPSAFTGYQWAGSRIKRWGTNFIDPTHALGGPDPLLELDFGSYGSLTYSSAFNAPAAGDWLSSTEAIGSLGDSGGGAFFWDGNQWVLSGIFSAVAAFSGQPSGTAAFGNVSLLTDVASYGPSVMAITGNLIPEPSSWLLASAAAASCLAGRRKRSS